MTVAANESYETVSGLEAYTKLVLQLVSTAHVELKLFSYDLDQRVYGSEEFCDTLKKFILQHRRAHLRAIVHTPSLAMRRGHRLIELGRLLSSRIEFRQLAEERQKLRPEYLIADQHALISKEAHDDIRSRYFAHAPLVAREQLKGFETIWQESTPAREFTDLKI